MKLLTKTTLYFFSAMVVLVVVTGFYLFHQFSRQLNDRSDKELLADEAQWIDYLETGVENGTTFILKTGELSIFPVNEPLNDYPKIEDVTGKNAKINSSIAYRQLSQVVSVAGIPYQIIIKKSQEQKTALVRGFTRVMLFVFAGLFFVSLVFNWVISRRLWAPFRESLKKIRSAELQHMQAMRFDSTNTAEFNELNSSLNAMTHKIYSDYLSMKEFTENAAHEMQTPIAVVQSKLELLLQDTNLENGQVQSVVEASAALSRLGKLNQGLLLLAKIDNEQYNTKEVISLCDITSKYLRLFDALIKDKQLTVTTNFAADFKSALHPFLADSLISNLLGNAIKYNYPGGAVNIATNEANYQISNSSLLPAIPQDKLFKRFTGVAGSTTASTGLGLAIVKKILDSNDLLVQYRMVSGLHEFVISKK